MMIAKIMVPCSYNKAVVSYTSACVSNHDISNHLGFNIATPQTLHRHAVLEVPSVQRRAAHEVQPPGELRQGAAQGGWCSPFGSVPEGWKLNWGPFLGPKYPK